MYKRKITTVRAIQWKGDNFKEIKNLFKNFYIKEGDKLKVKTEVGFKYVEQGSFLVLENNKVEIFGELEFNTIFEPIELINKIKEDIKKDE